MTPMTDVGAELVEIAPLDCLQSIGDGVEPGIVRGVVADRTRRILPVRLVRLETGAIPL